MPPAASPSCAARSRPRRHRPAGVVGTPVTSGVRSMDRRWAAWPALAADRTPYGYDRVRFTARACTNERDGPAGARVARGAGRAAACPSSHGAPSPRRRLGGSALARLARLTLPPTRRHQRWAGRWWSSSTRSTWRTRATSARSSWASETGVPSGDAVGAVVGAGQLAGATIRGVLVQAMVAGGTEVIVGARRDPQFGVVVLVGLGGVLAEVPR